MSISRSDARTTSVRRRAGRLLTASLLLAAVGAARAQQPVFVPDHANGIYAAGERVGWTATLPRGVRPAGPYTFTVFRDGATRLATGTLDLRGGRGRIETSLAEPGMLIVEVKPAVPDSAFGSVHTGGKGRVLLAASVDPARIRAAEPPPADFDSFWTARVAQLNAIPMEPVVNVEESGRPGVDFAIVRLNNVNGAHVYGQLAKPAGEGKHPGLVIYQWASPPYPLQRSWVTDRAAEGWLALNVEPHDVPPDMPQPFYDALPAMIKNYNVIGQHSREDSYFLQMYLGAYRAVEYLATRPEWDGKTIVVMGTSMGGMQSLAVAGLNPRVTALIVHVPAGADVTAELHGRGASYPNWNVQRADVLQTARYFDTANFAPRITARSLVSFGWIDEVSRPTGVWSVYDQLRGPKEAVTLIDAPHNHQATAEQQAAWTRRSAEWLDALVHGREPSPAPAAPAGR